MGSGKTELQLKSFYYSDVAQLVERILGKDEVADSDSAVGSTFECHCFLRLDECKIPYFYEKVRIKYFDTQRNKERVAVPDFYLPETKELVEIKSSWTLKGKVQEMKDKFKAYREQGYNPKLILDKVEQDLSNIEE